MGLRSILRKEVLLSAFRGMRCAHLSEGALSAAPSHFPAPPHPARFMALEGYSAWNLIPRAGELRLLDGPPVPAAESTRQGWAKQEGWAWAGELGSPEAASSQRYTFGRQRDTPWFDLF
ncbi:hypothetical protein NN561_010091 [Cricetulus griseus]